MICPCACAAMQRIGMDIDKIKNVPFYRVWYHPLWKEALKGIQLSDYNDLPFYKSTCLDGTSSNGTDTASNLNTEDTMQGYNSKIFKTIGNLGNISESQQVAKMREHYKKLEKIAVKSVKSTKYAICGMIEVTNRLGSISMASSNSNIHVTAIDKARHHHQNHTLQNSSPLKYLKRKVNIATHDNAQKKSKQSNCRVCRDVFNEPPAIYSSHRSTSSKWPHNNNTPSSCSKLGSNKSLDTLNDTIINPIISHTDGKEENVTKGHDSLDVTEQGQSLGTNNDNNDKSADLIKHGKEESDATCKEESDATLKDLLDVTEQEQMLETNNDKNNKSEEIRP
jgi:hypothetical protein